MGPECPESRVFKIWPMTVMSSPVVGRFTKVRKALLTHGTTTGSSVLSLVAESHGTGFQETAIDRGWGQIDYWLEIIFDYWNMMFILLIDYWLLMIGLFGFRWLPVWKSQQNPSKSVAHFKCETTAPRLRFPAIAAVPCPPKYISELRPVEPCWTLNPKPVALATYYPSGKLTKNIKKLWKDPPIENG